MNDGKLEVFPFIVLAVLFISLCVVMVLDKGDSVKMKKAEPPTPFIQKR